MTILITGGAGYIGSHCALALNERELPFVILDNLSTGHADLLPQNVPFYEGCAGDFNILTKIFKKYNIQTVMHLAGSTVVSDSVINPGAYFHNNTSISLSLLQACIQHNIPRIIFSSSAAVYGNNPKGLVTEAEPANPESPYAMSKWMTECMIHAFHKAHAMDAIILRYFNVAGADPQKRAGQKVKGATHLIKVGLEAALKQRAFVSIFGTDYDTPDGTGLRDYIHVSDLADAHVSALDWLCHNQHRICATFNCGYGQAHSVRSVLSAIEEASGSKLAIQEAPRRDGDLPALMADSTAFKKVTGWSPRFDNLKTIIETALAWERSQIGLNHEHAISQ